MKIKNIFLISFGIVSLTANTAQAWKHEVSISYGWGQEFLENYNNQAVLLFGKLYKFKKIDKTLIATIDGTIAHITTSAAVNKTLNTAALSLAFRTYFQNPDLHKIRPYLGASFGPVYLSQEQLGLRRQGSHFVFQSAFEGGVEFDVSKTRSLDLGVHLIHYCNAGFAHPNQGINVPFAVSLGYQF